MKKYIVHILIIIASVAVLSFSLYWMFNKNDPAYGTMIILSITFIAILLYTYYTFQILKESYKPYGTLKLEPIGKDNMKVIVSNLCKVPLIAIVNLNPIIEGKAIKLTSNLAHFSGEKEWILPSMQTIEKEISVFSVILAMFSEDENYKQIAIKYDKNGDSLNIQDKNTIINEFNKKYQRDISKRAKEPELKIEATIEFKDFKGNTYKENIKLKMYYKSYSRLWVKEIAEKI